MSVYVRAARFEGEITTDEADFSQAAYDMKVNTIDITSIQRTSGTCNGMIGLIP